MMQWGMLTACNTSTLVCFKSKTDEWFSLNEWIINTNKMNQWNKRKEHKNSKMFRKLRNKRENWCNFFLTYCFRYLVFYEKGTKTRHHEEQCGGTQEISTAVCWWGLENRPVVELLCRPEHVVISGCLWKHLDLVASKNTAAFNRETCVHLNTSFFQNVFTTIHYINDVAKQVGWQRRC